MASGSSPPSDSASPPSHDTIVKSASLAGTATLVSRILGLARETVQAAYFGAGNDVDAYLLAFRIPNLLRDLFAEGAMSAAFVPTFTAHLTTQGKASAWRLGNNVITTLMVVTAVLVALGTVFTTPLTMAYAEGFAAVPGKIDLTVRLTRIMLPFLTFVAVAAAVMGMLNALGHYFVPALSPAAFNVASIASAILLTPLMTWLGLPAVTAIAIGALIGGVGQLALQWPSLRREGFRFRPLIDFKDSGLRRVLWLMGPGTLGLAATQINLLVNTHLAAEEPGAVSWLQYAFRLLYLPIGLFGVSIATAVLPAVSRHMATDDRHAINRTVTRGIALMLLVNIPATIGLVVLAVPIVRLLLEHGKFLPSATLATASAVQYYAIGLVGYSAARIALPVFYAIGRSRIAVIVSTLSVLVNLGLSLTLAPRYGFRGLAFATSAAAVVSGVLAIALLHRQFAALSVRHIANTSVKTLLASAAMVAVIRLVSPPLDAWFPGSGLLSQSVRLAVQITSGVLAFGAGAAALRVPELHAVVDKFVRRRRLQLDR